MGTCQFCKTDKKLINSHIIPKCFFHQSFDQGICHREKGAIHGTSPKEALVEKLFCEDCDRSFSNLENYVKNFFYEYIPENRRKYLVDEKEFYSIAITKSDYVKLRRFFILTAYRSHLCSSIDYDLGDYAQTALDLLKNNAIDQNLFVPIIFQNIHMPEHKIIHLSRAC